MKYISIFIEGIPYGKNKRRGDTGAPKVWTDKVISQTLSEPKIKYACILKATFFLPKNKFPKNYKFGNDLDNLLKRFLDALNITIFSEAPGKDSCIISMYVTKTKVSDSKKAGVHLEILPVSI